VSAVVTEPPRVDRETLTRAMRAAVDRLDDHLRLVTGYHLGWCDLEGRATNASPGKAIRPTLVMLTAEAVGGGPDAGLSGAVAVELVHNFSLVHDDLMDRDAERRHRRTVWAVWGDATAVLAGDAMLGLAQEVLLEDASPYAARASLALAEATRELIHGQALDVAFEARSPLTEPVSLAECFDMAAGKTGALLAASAEVGALLGGAPPAACAALRTYGAELGMAFQLADDLLGVWGSPARTGKPVFSDLRSRKKTMPVVWATRYGGAAGRELARWLAEPDAHDETDLRAAADLLDRAGGRAWAIEEAWSRIRSALRALDAAGLDDRRRERFDALARFVIERDL